MRGQDWLLLGVAVWLISQVSRAQAALETPGKTLRELVTPKPRPTLSPGEAYRSGRVDIRKANAVLELAKRFRFADPKMATAIACAESRCNPRAIGDQGSSFGLWQIHLPAHPGYNAAELLTPEGNARAALKISKGGTDWKHWSTYKTGAYKRFLDSL